MEALVKPAERHQPSNAGRGAARESAICDAVIELLTESSFEALSMDAVAARAKASKATIYRRWSNKEDLVVDALGRVCLDRKQEIPDTGSLRGDLVAYATAQIEGKNCIGSNTALVRCMTYASANDPVLLSRIKSAFEVFELRAWESVLDRAYVSGELPARIDPKLPISVVQGMMQYTFCSSVSPDMNSVVDGFADLIDNVVLPVIRHAASSAAEIS